MITVEVPNTLRNNKLTETVNGIVEAVKAGEVVVVRNGSDFAVSTTAAVEGAKRELLAQQVRIFQSNKLDYREVLVPENPRMPFAKQKIHHYQVVLTVKLSSSPIDDIQDGETQQLIEPRVPKGKQQIKPSPELI